MDSTSSYINIPRPRGYQYRHNNNDIFSDDVPAFLEPSPVIPPINERKWEQATIIFEKIAKIGDTMLVTSNKMIGAYYFIQKIGEKTYRRCSELYSSTPRFTYDIKDNI